MPDLQNIQSNLGDLIVKVAKERAESYGQMYAKNQAPISPYKNLTSNALPEESVLFWLRGLSKCNQFIGDVLTKAGLKMPTFKMKDGSEHYMNAERLPKEKNYFSKVCNLNDLRAGDLIVLDNLARRGENGAHVELVSSVNLRKNLLSLIGARSDGAAERQSFLLGELVASSNCGFYRSSRKEMIYFLRSRLQ